MENEANARIAKMIVIENHIVMILNFIVNLKL